MPLPIKTYWPTLAQTVYRLCKFITKHSQTIIQVVTSVDPSQAAAVETALANIQAACTLFVSVMGFIDPNWKPK